MSTVRIATRPSRLATAQTELALERLRPLMPGVELSIVSISSEADERPDEPLADFGDKAAFVSTLERALIEGRADVAVHSLKDVAVVETPRLWIAAFLPREDPSDVMISRSGNILQALEPGSRVGTSSLRRVRQLQMLRSDLEYVDIRGNVDTRLRKLEDGRYDAIVLAAAGLRRLGLAGRVTEYFETDRVLPAPGQGIIALQCRENYEFGEELMAAGNESAMIAARAERVMANEVGATCNTPFGAICQVKEDKVDLRGWLGFESGDSRSVHVFGAAQDALDLSRQAAQEIKDGRQVR